MKVLFKKIIVAILTLEARLLLKRTQPQIIAITGSVGKTSVKDAVYTVVKDRVYTRKSEKSYNSEIGVPLSVLALKNAWSSPVGWLKNIIDGALMVLHPGKYPDLLVLEMGVDRPGDMASLTEWIKPDIVVLTRLPDVPVHVEFFDTPEAVVEEKKKLIDALKTDGVLVYNQDDTQAVAIADSIQQQSIGYSRNSLSPFTASGDKVVYDHGQAVGLEFTLTHLDSAQVIRVNGSLGGHHSYNYAAAVAVGSVLDIDMGKAAKSLHQHTPPPGRMRLIPGIKETTIIDDTYNASPVAMERAILTLKEIKGVERRVAVLGDMMELGQFSVREHEKVGELVATTADVLVTVGVRSHKVATTALDHGMKKNLVFKCDTADEVPEILDKVLKQGDVILVKGSQSIRAEKIVEHIMAEPEKAQDILVRQSEMWKSI